MAEFNPYQSPTGTSPQGDKPDPYEPVTLAELQARVVELEKLVKGNWFLGPLWKRSLGTFLHWVVGYAAIAMIVGPIWFLFLLIAYYVFDYQF